MSKPKPQQRKTAPAIATQADEAVATALARDAVTRERHVIYMRLIIGLLFALSVSVAGNVWLSQKGIQYKYFASDPMGRARELQALDQPVQSTSRVLTWSTDAVNQAFTFSFANYQQEIEQSRTYFTPGGWEGFRQALQEKGNLDAVIKNMYVATASPAKAAVVVDQGLVDGRYAWKLEVPLLITYQSATQEATQSIVVAVTVVQVPADENPEGLGIEQVIVK